MSSTNSINSEIERLSGEVRKSRDKSEFWDKWNIRFVFLAGFAGICLAIGAIGVSRSNKAVSDFVEQLEKAKDRKLQDDLKAKDGEIASLTRDTEDAKRDTSLVKLHISQANERASNADKAATEAKLELAKFRAPRTLTAEQRSAIEAAMKVFPKTPFDMWASADSEATGLAEEIEQALLAAGWEEFDAGNPIGLHRGGGKKSLGILIASGISVEIDQSRLPDLLKPCDDLITALKAQGLAIKGLATKTGNTPNAIHIKVGTKE